jgi:hypothetical protein
VDKATLVKSDLEAEGLVIEALSRAKIPITLCDWNFVPQLDEWQLVVATPWYDSKGPREANRLIINAFVQAGVYEHVPMRRFFVKSPNDPTVKAMERELRFMTEGSIHILKHAPLKYSVIFSPYTGPGGAVPSGQLTDEADLRDFLQNRIRISVHLVDEALSQLATKGNASIPNVQLSAKRAKRLGLA